MSDNDLKPCPFCGSENIYETYSQEYALGTKNPEIFCNSCKAIFSIEDDSPYMNCEEDFAYRRVKTAEAWNRRRLPSAQPELIRCEDCKHRPIATRADDGVLWGFSVEFPDERCPLQCEDGWYNHYPKDDFYCANAERRTDECD